ncbi:MAG TPA: hypothetical protein VEX68_08495, partial [Bryobacteraceae bacterium]|nr:hypothetical protein [Bryobacteraceae bacterium]
MTWCGDKHGGIIGASWIHASIVGLLNIWMDGLMSKVQAKWCVVTLMEELDRVIRQNVCHV